MGTGFEIGRTFHVGVRVVSLDAAMDEMGDSLGLTWSEPQAREQQVWTPATGLIKTPLRFTYSREGPLHVELLQGEPGTVWDATQAPGIHHIGTWVDDVSAETNRLIAAGWSLVGAQNTAENGYGAFTYLAPPTGLIVELVTSFVEPMFARWWAGGPLG